jgi:peroxiredoxin
LTGWLATAQTLPLPRPSPELKVPLITGQEFVLSSLRGKVVAVEFMYTTCPHCQKLAATTSKLLGEYQARGFRAIGVTFNPDAARLTPEFIKKSGATFPIGTGTNDTMFAFAGPPTREFRLPHLLFVDRKGFIRAQFTGEEDFFNDEEANLRLWIEKLLKEPAPATPAPPRTRRTR